MPHTAADPLSPFEPGVRAWFAETFGAPTAVQAAAWPLVAAGEHLLATAPTGSGKTLTAFLWALNQFAAGRWERGATRVLYVSPLKALNNDIRRNLLGPLDELSRRGAVPPVRVQTRSGDTPASERQRMLRRPPEILITTPESLNLMLTTVRGRQALGAVETVIVDEVHALVDNRRGTLLLTALERLARLTGEFQRIALSATVRPLAEVAAHVAGRDDTGRDRRMQVVDAGGDKRLSLTVRFPAAARDAADAGVKIWTPLAEAFRGVIAGNEATLVFANSRRLAERLTWAINHDQPEPLAYAHHGSLSREIRLEVESRLKAGELKAIVATSSLEMGIDIGALDEVVMVQAPPSVAATLQRIGRAGHGVGEESRGSLYPTFAQDFIDAAALAEAVAERDIEPVRCLANPLDVLCQIIVSMTASETWAVDELFELLRRSGPYRDLPRQHYDLVLEMLAGRYAGARVRELAARVDWDRIRGTLRARHAAVLAFYRSGGVIPDRGYYQIRLLDTGATLGELDEEFVWEARVGQVFSLGTQTWQIHRITHNDVLVRPAARGSDAPPFWRAEDQGRSFHFSRRIGAFLARAEALLDDGDAAGLLGELTGRRGFDEVAAATLVEHLADQRAATGTALPHLRHLLLERVQAGPGGYRGAEHLEQLVIHTFWGGRVNRPWSLALAAALADAAADLEVHADDNAVVLQSRLPLDDGVMRLVTPANLERLLRRSLESSGVFGARFREAAGRALLLTRQRFDTRLPLWMSRLQAKKLMSAVRDHADFPILLEVWRSCLEDEFDLPALRDCLAAVADGEITVSLCRTATPSPFAANVTFDQINRYMYATDQPEAGGPSALSDELIRAAVRDAELRPRLSAEAVALFESKRRRTAPGYAPDTDEDWASWIKERVLLPRAEGPDAFRHVDVAEVALGGRRWLVHRELLAALSASGLLGAAAVEGPVPDVADERDAETFALEALSFYGPRTAAEIAALLPAVPEGLLDDEDTLVRGPLLEGDDALRYCDPDNLETLLRMQRALRRPRIDPRPATDLPGFVAAWQGFGHADPDPGAEGAWLEPLRGYEAPVPVWLQDLPAARGVTDEALDRAFRDLGLAWQGAGSARVRLGYPEDLDLTGGGEPPPDAAGPDPAELFADPRARYPFLQLADAQDDGLADFNERFWQAVWAGRIAADTLDPLRRGLARQFRMDPVPAARRSAQGRRRAPRYGRMAPADPWGGTWFLTPPAAAPEEALLALEDAKERARMLLERYGVLCRELANREGGSLRWAALFRALRLLELAGEVVAGHFFEGLSGPQFALPAALGALSDRDSTPADFWCAAADPASPCGLALDWPELPQRRPRNYLAFRQGVLTLVIENGGRRLTFHCPPAAVDDRLLAPIAHLLARERRLTIEQINDAPARTSPYREPLSGIGRVAADHRVLHLERR